MQIEFTGTVSSQPIRPYFADEQLCIKFSSPMANKFHEFYLDKKEQDYLSCTESKWTIISPTTRYLIKAVEEDLNSRGYDNLIIKNSLSDYSKSRELTFPVSLFCLVRGLMLPPALSAKNSDVVFWEHFNDNGSPKTRSFKRRFNDAVDRYYRNRFIDFSITKPNCVNMVTPPSEVLLQSYISVIFKTLNQIDLFCLTYDDNRDYYVFGVSPGKSLPNYVRFQIGAKFSMEVIRDIVPVIRSKQDVIEIFERKLGMYMDDLSKEGFYGEVGGFQE